MEQRQTTSNIEEVFPEDPLQPTVQYIATSQTPFAVPWAKGRVRLCSGFNAQRAQNDKLFLEKGAFRDTQGTLLQYRECQTTSLRDESRSDVANSAGNASFAISASVGGSFLGASGRGSYEKSVRDASNSSNISVRADHVCGQIDAMSLPELHEDAVKVLRTSPNPIEEFRQTYGDFYVAGYRIGAMNSTIISGELANKAFFEAKRAEVKVKALFVTKNVSINEVERSGSDSGKLTVAAFDSLTAFYSKFTALTYEDSIEVGKIALTNKQNAMTIAARASEILRKEFSLDQEAFIYQNAVDRLCDRGLVTELLLAPFAGLREYQSLLSRRLNWHGH